MKTFRLSGGGFPGEAIASVLRCLLRTGPITARQIRDALAGTAPEGPRP